MTTALKRAEAFNPAAAREAAALALLKQLGHDLSPEQQAVALSAKAQLLVIGGEQSGKSFVTADILTLRYPFDKAKAKGQGRSGGLLYWLVGADYMKCQKEWGYLIENFTALGILTDASKRVDPGEMRLADGTVIKTKSAKDPRGIAMESPDGILACEAAQIEEEVVYRLQGRARMRDGWLAMTGTLEGSLGLYPKLWEAWQVPQERAASYSMPTWSNRAMFPGGRQDPAILDIEASVPEDFFLERYAGVPVPPKGLVFPEFRPWLHVRPEAVYVPGEQVYIWEDPGYGTQSAHAIEVCHVIGGQIRVFDEIYERSIVTEDLIDVCVNRAWWKEAKVLVTDPNYKDAHHSMPSVAETWLKKTGLVAQWSYGKLRILEGIERMKTFLRPDPVTKEANFIIHPSCKGIISEFGGCPNPFDGMVKVYRWKTGREGEIVGENPEDKHNHGVKAATYGMVQGFGFVTSPLGQFVHMRSWRR